MNPPYAGRPDIDQFEAAMMRENRTKGFFVSFGFTSDAMLEIGQFFKREHRIIAPLTVQEILDDQIAPKRYTVPSDYRDPQARAAVREAHRAAGWRDGQRAGNGTGRGAVLVLRLHG